MHEDDILLEIDEGSEGDVLIVTVRLPFGQLEVMAEFEFEGSTLNAKSLHVQSVGVMPNDLGIAILRKIAQRVMERTDSDELVVKGEVRTTGANPGHRPKRIRFQRIRRHPTD